MPALVWTLALLQAGAFRLAVFNKPGAKTMTKLRVPELPHVQIMVPRGTGQGTIEVHPHPPTPSFICANSLPAQRTSARTLARSSWPVSTGVRQQCATGHSQTAGF